MNLEESEEGKKQNEVLSQTDAIGPGHPPKQYQFRKGTSGNPKGRPKKPPKSHDLLWEELRKPIKLMIGSKEVRVTRLEAVLRQLKARALSGDLRAMNLYRTRVEEARLRKNHNKVEEEEPVKFTWTPEWEAAFQLLSDIPTDDDEPDENDLLAKADEAANNPQTAVDANTTIPTKPKENDHD